MITLSVLERCSVLSIEFLARDGWDGYGIIGNRKSQQREKSQAILLTAQVYSIIAFISS